MSDRVAFLDGRAFPRVALTGVALLWLAGCSSDMSRLDMSTNPFTNPFSAQTTAVAAPGAAPAGQVATAPLAAPPAAIASAPLPSTASAPAPAAVASRATAGWSASGGAPITVAEGETLDTVSRRYGVPASALLAANGLSSASEVKSGARMIVPVYNAGNRAVASAEKATSETSPKAAKAEVADRGDAPKTKTAKADKAEKIADKTKPQAKAEAKTADAKPAPADTQVAKADPAKPAKGQAIDATPTGNVDPKAGAKASPITSEQADAAGGSPEFRWPARGRIIQGFKTGGNDGIDISVPAGTSVRAAENGVVVYSGDGLKGYGNLVLIKHPNGFVSAYANNGELDVKRGQQVKRGEVIAKSGDSGNVNAPQLHFELRKGSTPVDPTQYLAGL
jgi:murein DD-endopeptidase MepM/ murein hydrolase activator NlpD